MHITIPKYRPIQIQGWINIQAIRYYQYSEAKKSFKAMNFQRVRRKVAKEIVSFSINVIR